MTATSEAIIEALSTGPTDWAVTGVDRDNVLKLVRNDPLLPNTIRDLKGRGQLDPMLYHMILYRRRGETLMQVLGAKAAVASGALIANSPRLSRELRFLFLVSNQLHNNLRKLNPAFQRIAFNSADYAAVVAPKKTHPFGGSGATGVSPAAHGISIGDQVKLGTDDRVSKLNKAVRAYNAKMKNAGRKERRAELPQPFPAVTARYSNPLPGSLSAYLRGLTPGRRRAQARLLVNRPIISIVPQSYLSGLPTRADIMRLAGRVYHLSPALIAAFLLAEQRDQSQNEDAKDHVAATSLAKADTSIGLGQVLISTARRNFLFSYLLNGTPNLAVNHNEVASLLTSDEFNIFAVAKYIRLTANGATKHSAKTLPGTVAAYPRIDFAAFGGHSRIWPADNIRALGSEYTSIAWDDKLSGWGHFVYEAYRDLVAAGMN